MPPEWAPHGRCWMAWPCRPELWGERMAAARRAVAEVAQAIAEFEPVTMLARPELIAEASLQCGKGISVLPMAYDDSWTRDTGPTFVTARGGGLAGVDWRFNGYGGRSPAFERDDAVARAVRECLGDAQRYRAMSARAVETARQYSLERWRDTIGELLWDAWKEPLTSCPISRA